MRGCGGVGDGIGLGFGVGDGVGDGIGDGDGLGDGATVGDGIGLGVGTGDGVGFGMPVGVAVGLGFGRWVGLGLGAWLGLTWGGRWLGLAVTFGDAGASLTTGEALGDTDGLPMGSCSLLCPHDVKATNSTAMAATVVITIFERVDAGLFFIFIFSCAVSA